MKEKVFHGRDEHGFVIGSPQARQFQRMLDSGCDPECAGRKNPSVSRRAERTRETLLRNLQKPEWWDSPDEETGKSRRYWTRQQAKRAARRLGVAVPEWALKTKRRVSKYYVPEPVAEGAGDLT